MASERWACHGPRHLAAPPAAGRRDCRWGPAPPARPCASSITVHYLFVKALPVQKKVNCTLAPCLHEHARAQVGSRGEAHQGQPVAGGPAGKLRRPGGAVHGQRERQEEQDRGEVHQVLQLHGGESHVAARLQEGMG